jgi:hypothetical protein
VILNAASRPPGGPPVPSFPWKLSVPAPGPAVLPTDRPITQADLQARANHFLHLRGKRSDVSVLLSEDVEGAFADGHCVGDRAQGQIGFGTGLLEKLTPDEVDFVLAHEVVHIAENHVLPHRVPHLVETLVLDIGPLIIPELAALRFPWDVVRTGRFVAHHPDSRERITEQQEYAADAGAVRLTGKLEPAVSALTKLVDGDLSAMSHGWIVFTAALPIMTMGERIAKLKNAGQTQTIAALLRWT